MITQSSNVLSAPSIAADVLSVHSPIATPELRAAARAAVVDIARAAPSYVKRRDDGTLDPSLAGGAAGVAVFLHYAANALDDADIRTACIDVLGEALAGLHSLPHAGLCGGYPGVAWAVSHLQQRGVDELDDVDLSEVDTIVETLLRRVPWPGDYDLVTGLVGLGVYGLERMHQGAGEVIVAAVVNRLAEMAEWVGDSAAWFHPPWLLPHDKRDAFPEGWYNLGVAHGIPGVLGFLARAAQHDVRRATTMRLLAAGSLWTCSQVQSVGPGEIRLGYQVDPRAPRDASGEFRDAWCYGSPGAAVALLAAARVLGDERVGACAIALARTAAHHDPVRAGVVDASFCHGSSGLAHLYARLHALTGEPAFADAARRWLDHTLTFKTPGEGVGGFSHITFEGGQRVSVAGSNFLEGAAGIGLVLLSMCSSEPPSWDRVVLADPSLSFHLASR
ncbi:MAG TPA: lanthionine synthetase C family protein [Gemmatimonadaceae bacterium]|nr:lanthionine synthetase C family protein [Gemmatimonadaceae bacterium]